MECLISDMSKLDLKSPQRDGETKPQSVMSQARLLITPVEEDITTNSATSSDFSDQAIPFRGDDVQNVDIDSGKDLGVGYEPLPLGIVYCGGSPTAKQSFTPECAVKSMVRSLACFYVLPPFPFTQYQCIDRLGQTG